MAKHRRGHGEGSIYKRQDGRWVAAYHDVDGKRQTLYGHTRQDVQDRLHTELQRKKDGEAAPDEKQTVEQWLNAWLSKIKPEPNRHGDMQGHVRSSTWRGYEEKVRGHLVPGLGRIPLVKLTPAQVEAYLGKELRAGLSPRSVSHVRAVLRAALADAQKKVPGVRQNAAAIADLPTKVTTSKVSPLDPADVGKLLEAVKGHRFGALYLLAVTTGARQGELLGLTWSAIDLDRARISIRQTLHRDSKAKTYRLEPPKSETSNRDLVLPELARTALELHRDAQALVRKRIEGKKAKWGNEWDLVFTTNLGEPLHYSVVLSEFQALLAGAGLPKKRFHDLRHGAASLLIAGGASLHAVKEQLGHSDISLTSNTYGHIFDEQKKRMASIMDDAFGPLQSAGQGGA